MSTLFVDNLPQNINSQDLRRFFSTHGQQAEAYVPHIQRRRVQGRFGFVEVGSREQGDRLIRKANGTIFGCQRIRVQWARYPRRSRRLMRSWQTIRSRQQRWTWKRDCNHDQGYNRGMRRPNYQAKMTIMSDEVVQKNKTAKVIKLEKVNENL